MEDRAGARSGPTWADQGGRSDGFYKSDLGPVLRHGRGSQHLPIQPKQAGEVQGVYLVGRLQRGPCSTHSTRAGIDIIQSNDIWLRIASGYVEHVGHVVIGAIGGVDIERKFRR